VCSPDLPSVGRRDDSMHSLHAWFRHGLHGRGTLGNEVSDRRPLCRSCSAGLRLLQVRTSVFLGYRFHSGHVSSGSGLVPRMWSRSPWVRFARRRRHRVERVEQSGPVRGAAAPKPRRHLGDGNRRRDHRLRCAGIHPWRGKPQQVFLFTRYFAPSLLIQSNNVQSDEFIKLTANPAKGKGGTCFGDSGGSDFLAGTTTILAVNSYVTNGNCTGVTYSQRVDLPDIQDFINSVN